MGSNPTKYQQIKNTTSADSIATRPSSSVPAKDPELDLNLVEQAASQNSLAVQAQEPARNITPVEREYALTSLSLSCSIPEITDEMCAKYIEKSRLASEALQSKGHAQKQERGTTPHQLLAVNAMGCMFSRPGTRQSPIRLIPLMGELPAERTLTKDSPEFHEAQLSLRLQLGRPGDLPEEIVIAYLEGKLKRIASHRHLERALRKYEQSRSLERFLRDVRL